MPSLRGLLGSALLALGGCATLRSGGAVPEQVLALASFGESVLLPASATWPGWRPTAVPYAIVGPREQWIFHAPVRPRGYAHRAYPSPLGALYRARSFTDERGKHRPAMTIFFVRPSADAHGAILFIAPPDTPPPPGSDATLSVTDWATMFVHEDFHTFQMTDPAWNKELPDDAARASLEKAVVAPSYQNLVKGELALERMLLLKLAESHQLGLDDLAPLLAVRRTRHEKLGARAETDRALERMEGIARYVEQMVYDRADTLSVLHARDPKVERFTLAQQLDEGLIQSPAHPFYATGFALAMLLEAIDPSWKQRVVGRDMGALLVEAVTRKR